MNDKHRGFKFKVKPDCLGAFAKNARTPLKLGRVMFALFGREDELDPPLDEGEEMMADTIMEQGEWYEERMGKMNKRKELKNRKDYIFRKIKDGTASKDEVDEYRIICGDLGCSADSADSADLEVQRIQHPNQSINQKEYNQHLACARACDGLTRETPLDVWVRSAKEDGVYLPMPDLMRKSAMDRKIPVDYIGDFLRTMRDCGWEYLNRGGEVVRLNQRNFPSVLKSFYDHKDMKPSKGGNRNGNNGMPIGVIYRQEGYDASKGGI